MLAIALPVAVAAAAGAITPEPQPSNLRVLPRDSTPSDIKILMDRYNEELGVSCDYCHTQDARTQKLDYASDDNPAKQTARVMIAMLNDINSKYLAQLDDQKYASAVSCGNCHRGRTEPPEFEPAPSRVRATAANGR